MALVIRRPGVPGHGITVPCIPLLVQIEEHAVVRVVDAHRAFALIHDRRHRLQSGIEVADDDHVGTEEIVGAKLHLWVVAEDGWVVLGDFAEA